MRAFKLIEHFNPCTTVSTTNFNLQNIMEQAELILQHCSLAVAGMTTNKLQKQATG